MIKDVMESLDGTPVDEVRLAAVVDIAEYLESHITALFLNMLPPLVAAEWEGIGAAHAAQVMQAAVEDGNRLEAALRQRLTTVLNREGVIFWSYCSPIAVQPGADGILDALERMAKQENKNGNAQSSSHAA